MNKLLKALYDCFYTPLELPAQKQEIEECHQALIEVLEKPERRLVLQIIDAKDRIVEGTSIDSFISGFALAWRISAELNTKRAFVLSLYSEEAGRSFHVRKGRNKMKKRIIASTHSPPVWPCVPLCGRRTIQPWKHPYYPHRPP